jgi:hypothetical protein
MGLKMCKETENSEAIKQQIKALQKELDNIILYKRNRIDELIELSQEIDKLIVAYYLSLDVEKTDS